MLQLETENYYDFIEKNHKIVCNTYTLVTPHFSSAYHLNYYAWVGLISCIIHNFFFSNFQKKKIHLTLKIQTKPEAFSIL